MSAVFWGLILLLNFAVAPSVHGQAADLAGARALFDRGDFSQAVDAGEALDTADGWALAARALLVEAAYLTPLPEGKTLLLEAETAARVALRKDPNNIEAMLHLVIALGYRARIEGTARAHAANRGGEAKVLIDRALQLEPENAWAWSALGAWNGEIVHSGGSFLGGIIYGASVKKARDAFNRGMALAPENISIRVEYAKILLHLSIPRYRNEAAGLLDQALALTPRNAFDKILAGQAHALHQALESGDDEQLEAALKAASPFVR